MNLQNLHNNLKQKDDWKTYQLFFDKHNRITIIGLIGEEKEQSVKKKCLSLCLRPNEPAKLRMDNLDIACWKYLKII